jgi:NAD(P)H-dependent flavin oxidoreductase YrpB (nitropropane dioxygenase family)
MRRNQDLTWAQLAMAANAPMLTRAALVEGRLDAGILPTGQVVGLVDELPAVEDVVEGIIAEAASTLQRLGSSPADPDTNEQEGPR